MNIDVWEEELKAFGLLADFLYLLDGFKEGFHQGIPIHKIDGMKWFSPPNHRSALDAREKIEANIKKEVASGRMYGPFSDIEVQTFRLLSHKPSRCRGKR